MTALRALVSLNIEAKRGMGWAKKKAKGGQAQGPLVKSVHIPLLSEGTQANPGLLRREKKAALMTKNLIF